MNDIIVTDKQVEQILRHLAVASEQSDDGIAIVDLSGTVRFVNPFWATMHGYNTTDELVGKHIGVFHTQEQMEADIIPFMEETKNRDQLAGPVEHMRSDGAAFGTQTKMTAAKDEQGNVIGLVVFAADTTQNNPGQQYFTDKTIEPITADGQRQTELTAHELSIDELKEHSDQLQERIEDTPPKLSAAHDQFQQQTAEHDRAELQEKLETETEARLKIEDELQVKLDARSEGIAQAPAKAKVEACAEEIERARAEAKSQANLRAQAVKRATLYADQIAELQEELKAEIKERAKAQAKVQSESVVRAEAQQQAQAQAQAEEKTRLYRDAIAKAKERAKSCAETAAKAEEKLKAEIEARLKAEEQAKAEILAKAIANEEAAAYAQAKGEAEKKIETEAKARAEAAETIAKVKAEAAELAVANEQLQNEITKKSRAKNELQHYSDELQQQIAGHEQTEQRLRQQNEELAAANDQLQQQITEQKAKSDSQTQEAIADIKAEYEKQLANVEAETEQAITEQRTRTDEAVQQAAEVKVEFEQALAEADSQAEEKEKTYNEMIAKIEAETTGTIAKLKAEAEEKARSYVAEIAKLQEKLQAETEVRLKVEDELKAKLDARSERIAKAQAKAEGKAKAKAQADKKAYDKALAEAREKIEAAQKAEAEERVKAKAELKAKRQAIEKARIYAQAKDEAEKKIEAEAKARAEAVEIITKVKAEAVEEIASQKALLEAQSAEAIAKLKAGFGAKVKVLTEEIEQTRAKAKLQGGFGVEAERKSKSYVDEIAILEKKLKTETEARLKVKDELKAKLDARSERIAKAQAKAEAKAKVKAYAEELEQTRAEAKLQAGFRAEAEEKVKAYTGQIAELVAANKKLQNEIIKQTRTENTLKEGREQLEQRIAQRIAELTSDREQLKQEIAKGQQIEQRLAQQADELTAANKQVQRTSAEHAQAQQRQAGQRPSEIVVEKRPRETSLRDFYYVFFRHKWKMVLFFFTVIVIVAVGTFLCAEVYRSEAKLLVRLGRESVTLDPTVTTGQITQISQSRENEINSELEILKSRELIEKVVDSIGVEEFLKRPDEKLPVGDSASEALRKARWILRATVGRSRNLLGRFDIVESLSDRDKATLKVMKNLEIENLKDNSIISISYKAKSPRLAQKVVAKLIDLYLEKHIAVHQTPGSYQFFIQQSEHLREKLAQSENMLRSSKNETGVSSVEKQRQVILDRIGSLEQEIGRTDAELASSRANVQALQNALAKLPETIVTEETTGFANLGADAMREQLFELQLEKQKLLSNFTRDSRMVEAVQREIVEAQALLDKEEAARTQVTRGLNAAHQQLLLALLTEQTNLSSLQAKIESQNKQYADARAELKTLNDAEVRIMRLMREIATQETNYRKYCENLEEARIDQAMESERISNISVVQAATLPIKAIRPQKLLNLSLGLILGILGAIVLAIFSEYLDHSIKTPEEAEERLQLPALASIPRVRTNRASPIVKLKGQTKADGKIAEKVPAKLGIPARIREHYEAFRERLLLCSNGSTGAPYVLAVIGCQRHEGVSAVAANLATTLSRHHENGHVLLVDANIAHPSVHQVFKTKVSPGLTDILANGQNGGDTIQSLPTQNLHILSAGAPNGNLSEAFDSDNFTKLLNSMKNHYDFVVIDIPALNEASSAARLASLCDGVVLVVEAERLRWEVAQRAKEQLVESNANILGVVLNKRRFHVPGWLYRRL